MSHTSMYKNITIQNVDLLCELAKQKGYEVKQGNLTVNLYGQNGVENCQASILVDGWRYEIAVKGGQLYYDNFGSQANSMENLGTLLQEYNEAYLSRNIDYSQFDMTNKQIDTNGNIVLTFEIF